MYIYIYMYVLYRSWVYTCIPSGNQTLLWKMARVFRLQRWLPTKVRLGIGNHSGYPRMGWILSNSIHLWEIFRILKWRYVSTIFLAIFWYPLGLKIGIFFIVGTSNLGSWNGYWTYLYLSIRIPANPIKSNHNRHVDRVGHTIQVPLQPRCTQYMLLPSQLLGHWPAPLLGSFTFLRTMMLLMSLYIETEIDIDMYIYNIYIYIYVCILHVYIYMYNIYIYVCVCDQLWMKIILYAHWFTRWFTQIPKNRCRPRQGTQPNRPTSPHEAMACVASHRTSPCEALIRFNW